MTSRASRLAIAAAAATAGATAGPAEAETAVASSVRDNPFVAALLALASAVAAVASFPNQPVPISLVDRITRARSDLEAAANQFDGLFGAGDLTQSVSEPIDPPAPYDDKWIRDTFDALDEALKMKFADLTSALDAKLAASEERITAAVKAAIPAPAANAD